MGIPVVPSPIQTPEGDYSRIRQTQVYEADESDLFLQFIALDPSFSTMSENRLHSLFLPSLDDLIETSYIVEFFIPSPHNQVRSFFTPVSFPASDRLGRPLFTERGSPYSELLSRLMRLLYGPDPDMKSEKEKKKKSEKVFVDFSYSSSEDVFCNKIKKWFVHHIKDRPVFKLFNIDYY